MNTLGKNLVFTSFGESHGKAIGGVLDGVHAGLSIDMDMIREALDKRAGRSCKTMNATPLVRAEGMSPRAVRETDEVEWLSGVKDGLSLGTPIAFIIRNKDARPQDYEWLKENYRIGHADFTYQEKYGIRDHRGGGRASARETAARVVAGSIAHQLLLEKGIHIHAQLVQVGEETDSTKFNEYIADIQRHGDSIGGIVECRITGMPVGVGEPIFDKLQSHLAFAMMSINACKGFEYGSGFQHVGLKGSEMYLSDNSAWQTGGIAGGISDGKEIVFRCVFKPTATNRKTVAALDANAPVGRHDACIAVRAVAVVEAMAGLVIADLMQENDSQKEANG